MFALFFAFFSRAALAGSCDVIVATGDITGDGLENTGIDPDEIDVAEAIVDGLEISGIDPDEIDLACKPKVYVFGIPLDGFVPTDIGRFSVGGVTATTREHVLLARQVSSYNYDGLGRLTNVVGQVTLEVDTLVIYEETDRNGRGTGVWLADLGMHATGATVPRGYEAVAWYAENTALSLLAPR